MQAGDAPPEQDYPWLLRAHQEVDTTTLWKLDQFNQWYGSNPDGKDRELSNFLALKDAQISRLDPDQEFIINEGTYRAATILLDTVGVGPFAPVAATAKVLLGELSDAPDIDERGLVTLARHDVLNESWNRKQRVIVTTANYLRDAANKGRQDLIDAFEAHFGDTIGCKFGGAYVDTCMTTEMHNNDLLITVLSALKDNNISAQELRSMLEELQESLDLSMDVNLAAYGGIQKYLESIQPIAEDVAGIKKGVIFQLAALSEQQKRELDKANEARKEQLDDLKWSLGPLAFNAARAALSLVRLTGGETGAEVAAVGGFAVTMAESFHNYVSLLSEYKAANADEATMRWAGGLGMAAMSFNLMGAAIQLTSILADHGPSADQIIIEGLRSLQDQVQTLHYEMRTRFDLVDDRLAIILDRVDEGFSLVLAGQATLQEKVADLQWRQRKILYDLNWSVTQVLEGLAVIHAEDFWNAFTRVIMGVNPDYLGEYKWAANAFYNHAAVKALDPLFAGVCRTHPGDAEGNPCDPNSAGAVLHALEIHPLHRLINYLAHLARNRWGIADMPAKTLPNPNEWLLGATAYVELLERPEWEDLARRVRFDRPNDISNDFGIGGTGILDRGRDLKHALDAIADEALWQGLSEDYRGSLIAVTNRLDRFRNDFQQVPDYGIPDAWARATSKRIEHVDLWTGDVYRPNELISKVAQKRLASMREGNEGQFIRSCDAIHPSWGSGRPRRQTGYMELRLHLDQVRPEALAVPVHTRGAYEATVTGLVAKLLTPDLVPFFVDDYLSDKFNDSGKLKICMDILDLDLQPMTSEGQFNDAHWVTAHMVYEGDTVASVRGFILDALDYPVWEDFETVWLEVEPLAIQVNSPALYEVESSIAARLRHWQGELYGEIRQALDASPGDENLAAAAEDLQLRRRLMEAYAVLGFPALLEESDGFRWLIQGGGLPAGGEIEGLYDRITLRYEQWGALGFRSCRPGQVWVPGERHGQCLDSFGHLPRCRPGEVVTFDGASPRCRRYAACAAGQEVVWNENDGSWECR